MGVLAAGWLTQSASVVCVCFRPTKYAGDKLAAGIKPAEFDPFMELILIDEVSRAGSGG